MNSLPSDDGQVLISVGETVSDAVHDQRQEQETLGSVIMRGMLALQEREEQQSPLAKFERPLEDVDD